MISGIWSLAANVGIPLIGKAIKSIIDQSQSTPAAKSLSIEQELAQKVNLTKMNKAEFDSFASDLYNMGAINLEELNSLNQFSNQFSQDANSKDMDFISAINHYLNDKPGIDKAPFKLLQGLNELRQNALSVNA